MTKQKILNKKLVEDLLVWIKVDQELRFASKDNKETGKYLVYLVDAAHGYRLRTFIATYGYPTEELLGKEGMDAFWLLVQHQDFDLDLQKDCLLNCVFSSFNHAHLLDRVLINEGKKQKYGTQLTKDEQGRVISAPIEDTVNVDKRREEAGLPLLSEYLNEANSA